MSDDRGAKRYLSELRAELESCVDDAEGEELEKLERKVKLLKRGMKGSGFAERSLRRQIDLSDDLLDDRVEGCTHKAATVAKTSSSSAGKVNVAVPKVVSGPPPKKTAGPLGGDMARPLRKKEEAAVAKVPVLLKEAPTVVTVIGKAISKSSLMRAAPCFGPKRMPKFQARGSIAKAVMENAEAKAKGKAKAKAEGRAEAKAKGKARPSSMYYGGEYYLDSRRDKVSMRELVEAYKARRK